MPCKPDHTTPSLHLSSSNDDHPSWALGLHSTATQSILKFETPQLPKLILLSRYLNNESRTTTYQRHFPHTPPNQPSLIIPTPGKPPSIHPLDDHPPPTRAPAAPGQHPPPGRPRQAGQTGSGAASGSRGWMCGIGAMVMAWVLRAKTASKKMAMISIFGWVGRLGMLVT